MAMVTDSKTIFSTNGETPQAALANVTAFVKTMIEDVDAW
jgi:hypothetical protein